MTRLFCLAMMLFGLGACNEADTPTLAAVANENCGEFAIAANPPRFTSDRTAARISIACFVQAAATCSATTLTVSESDRGMIRQFSVNPTANGCVIRQALQVNANAQPAVADCSAVEARGEGLVVSNCSHLGDFTFVP